MAFPLTHLLVAEKVLESFPTLSPEQFLLGSVAPDAVHYRAEFVNSSQSNIGATKKITHLCPVSDEKWGQVTDNNGWVVCVQKFLTKHNNSLAQGYAVHVLTDIFNNKTLWFEFRTKHPDIAAQGYQSGYYQDLHKIDHRLYKEVICTSNTFEQLKKATPQDMPKLISAQEMQAIQNNLVNIAYANAPQDTNTSDCNYITYEEMQKFINKAADFCLNVLTQKI